MTGTEAEIGTWIATFPAGAEIVSRDPAAPWMAGIEGLAPMSCYTLARIVTAQRTEANDLMPFDCAETLPRLRISRIKRDRPDIHRLIRITPVVIARQFGHASTVYDYIGADPWGRKTPKPFLNL